MENIIVKPETEFFIVSLKHTGKKDKYITLWRPDDKGYCYALDFAGRYNGYQQNYHNSDVNVPVPSSEIPAKLVVKDDQGRDCIKNNKASVEFIKLYIV